MSLNHKRKRAGVSAMLMFNDSILGCLCFFEDSDQGLEEAKEYMKEHGERIKAYDRAHPSSYSSFKDDLASLRIERIHSGDKDEWFDTRTKKCVTSSGSVFEYTEKINLSPSFVSVCEYTDLAEDEDEESD